MGKPATGARRKGGAKKAATPTEPSEQTLQRRVAELEKKANAAELAEARLELKSVQTGVWELVNLALVSRVYSLVVTEPALRKLWLQVDAAVHEDRHAKIMYQRSWLGLAQAAALVGHIDALTSLTKRFAKKKKVKAAAKSKPPKAEAAAGAASDELEGADAASAEAEALFCVTPTPLRLACEQLAKAAEEKRAEARKIYEHAALLSLDGLPPDAPLHAEDDSVCYDLDDPSQHSVLILAARGGSEKLCRGLCERGARLAAYAVFKALENGHASAAEWLLRHVVANATEDEAEYAQQTAPHVIVENASNGAINLDEYVRLMDALEDLGIPITMYNYAGRTPLHVACIEQNVDPIGLDLLRRGADPSAVDAHGRTPDQYLSTRDGGALVSMFSFYASEDAANLRVIS